MQEQQTRSHALMRILLLAVLSGTLTSAAPNNDPECSAEYLEKCAKDIFLWAGDIDGVEAPGDAAELAAFCKRQAAAEVCLRKRSEKCHSSVTKGFTRLLYDSIHEEYEQRCDATTDLHADYLRLAPCIKQMSPEMINCTIHFIITAHRALDGDHGKSLRLKIPNACCTFAQFSSCAETAARTRCDEDTALFVRQYLDHTSGELLSFVCESYTADSDTCQKRLASKGFASSDEALQMVRQYGTRTMLGGLSKLSESLQAARG